jgi:predicted DNA-binding antitoxin AbrB/MazE fold protein
MSEILTAVYEGGAFVPEQAPHCRPGERVRLVVAPLTDGSRESADEFDELVDALAIDSGGSRMTRDELHERR